jgi:uncharacterized membrane protein YvbJ
MICSHCGKVNENENNFCKHCGYDLNSSATDPNRTIFSTPQISNVDLGYLIISILILINVFMWLIWGFVARSIIDSDTQVLYKVVRVISIMLVIGQFVVMFVFSRRPAHKIIVAVIAAVVIIYDLYYLIETLTMRGY